MDIDQNIQPVDIYPGYPVDTPTPPCYKKYEKRYKLGTNKFKCGYFILCYKYVQKDITVDTLFS